MTRSAVEPNSFRTRTACFDSASIERSSGVFLSSASPVQLTNAVGMTSVTDAAAVEQPRRAGRIPRRVAARLEGGAHAAGREARGVGLAPDQFLARELRDRLAVAGRRQKRVVLLGGDAGQRLEPVRVVRRAVLDRPVLHRRGHRVGDRRVERLAVRDRPPQRVIDRLGQPRLLHCVVEHQAAERVVRRASSLCPLPFVTDQSRIALIASPSTAEPIVVSPLCAGLRARPLSSQPDGETGPVRTPNRNGAKRASYRGQAKRALSQ